MAKRNFLEKVYNKAQTVLTTQSFDEEMQKFLTTNARLGDAFAPAGPAVSSQIGIELFRKKVRDNTKNKKISIEEYIVNEAKKGQPFSKWNSRAAFLKLLMHFNRHSKRGAQDTWIYSPPEEYTKWIFEEISGTENRILRKIQKTEEIYSENEKNAIVDGLQIALSCSQKTEMLLATANEATLKIVARWFGSESSTPEELKEIANKLLNGFKKITNVCNANNLIFSDDPGDRKSTSEYEDLYASVWRGGEGNIKVMYIAGNFKKAGNSGRIWLCALTIIHEASHLELDTKDIRLDVNGLKPGISFSTALNNADSWGYFCMDLCGYLSDSDFQKTWR